MCVKSLSSHTSAPLPPPGHMYPSPSSRNWKYGDLKYFNVGIIIFSRVKRMRIIYFSRFAAQSQPIYVLQRFGIEIFDEQGFNFALNVLRY